MTGSCHCGAVRVTVTHKPDYVNFCDCSLCAKSGGVWGYYESADVTVKGETRGYRRVDYDEPAVEVHHCPHCGTTTHWVLTEHLEGDRMGVNARIFEPAELYGVEARFPDGRNWFGETAPGDRRPPGKLGVDAFL
ncbi:MAG: aldehyde-activating protein [Erythrobacter sp.]|uniref:GFA family protein n=1 Tax=Erythrobacter sp. TaxID=1042 RepID=UPI0026029225|nr:aldehyde-activating protein [Erythrobacter sp.]MDJ0978623.1 aldehyde-activating protein [Erythrobacter sp.]